eukprot:scaffold2911_cov73-Skeletonema_marinoi.AAC.6
MNLLSTQSRPLPEDSRDRLRKAAGLHTVRLRADLFVGRRSILLCLTKYILSSELKLLDCWLKDGVTSGTHSNERAKLSAARLAMLSAFMY